MEQLESCNLRWDPQCPERDREESDSLQDSGCCGHSFPEATIHISLGGVIRELLGRHAQDLTQDTVKLSHQKKVFLRQNT